VEDGTPRAIDGKQLQVFLDGRWAWVRDEVRQQLHDYPLLRPVHNLPDEEYRARVTEQMRALSRTRGPKLLFPKDHGGEGEIGAAVTAFEMLALIDLSLLVKAGVHWGLFGGAIEHLGTRGHHERYLHQAMTMELPGCFGMTETGHGSDVQSIRTTAMTRTGRNSSSTRRMRTPARTTSATPPVTGAWPPSSPS
jgi:acyl-CoA oxidase